jgi:hypothetical protein
MKKLVIALVVLTGLVSCEKTDNGTGKHVALVTNTSSTSVHVAVYIDGQWKVSGIAHAGESGFADCSDLVSAVKEDNVFVSTSVTGGEHTIEVRDAASSKVMAKGTFKSDPDACIVQQIEI